MKYPDSNVFYKQLGTRVKELRMARHLSQRDLGYLAELEKSVIQRIERGGVNSTLRTLIKLANALDISFEELFKDFDEEIHNSTQPK